MNKIGLHLKNRVGVRSAVCAAVLLACLGGVATTAFSNIAIPDDQKAILTVQGQGATPFSEISLSTGAQQTLSTKADGSGQFTFSNLQYASFADLKFSLDIPPYQKGMAKNYPANHLEFKYNAKQSVAEISGIIGKYGTLAFNMAGSSSGGMRFSGAEGYVSSEAQTDLPMSSGQAALTASIVNAGEICCPRMIVPAAPITLTILSQPIAPAPPVVIPQKQEIRIPGIVTPSVMPIVPKTDTPVPQVNDTTETPVKKSNPYLLLPNKDQNAPNNQQDENKPKSKNPYIVQGRIELEPTIIVADDIVAATSFSSADYDRTYVGGLKKIADANRDTTMLRVASMGAFLDSRTLMDTLRSLQMSTARTLRNYTASDAVCRFGTLSKSVAGADGTATANQVAFSKIMMDRSTQKEGSSFADPGSGVVSAIKDFKTKYCSTVDNNTFLEGYCKTATATADQLYNRDVDFTRVFDVPLTLDADFSTSAVTNDKQAILALFNNLSMVPPVMGSGADAFDPRNNSAATQDIRALQALKTVTANSFGALVGEKAKSSAQASSYMKEMIQQLGVDATVATKLLGDNPSYFAQMEVLTKKLFQNPAFYANLYDSEANIDRQRVAMKAIELQQDRDFLESLRRREVMLSVLLNAKLQSTASSADESGYVTRK